MKPFTEAEIVLITSLAELIEYPEKLSYYFGTQTKDIKKEWEALQSLLARALEAKGNNHEQQ